MLQIYQGIIVNLKFILNNKTITIFSLTATMTKSILFIKWILKHNKKFHKNKIRHLSI